MGSLLARATQGATQRHIRYVRPVPPGTATGVTAEVYHRVARDFGMLAPPVTLHSPSPGPLAACWLMLRETLIATGAASREAKETVAAAVSAANSCPYCVEVHGVTLAGLVRGPDAMAVAAGELDMVADPRLRGIGRWAATSQRRPAVPPDGGLCPPEQVVELIGVAVTFHYLNRMVNIFLQPSPLPAGLPAPARRGAIRMAARLMAALSRPQRRAGDSLDLLPGADAPADLSWTNGRPPIADAMARACAAIDAAGDRRVAEPVRQLVLRYLDGWDGRAPALGERAWLDDAVAGLSEQDEATARLAVLTAVASYQVTETVVEGFRVHHPDDAALIDVAAWASMAAARRAGALLHSGCTQAP